MNVVGCMNVVWQGKVLEGLHYFVAHWKHMLVTSWEKYVTMIGVVWERHNFVGPSGLHALSRN